MDELLFKITVEGNEANISELARLKGELLLTDKTISGLNRELKAGKVSLDEYTKKVSDLTARKKALKTDTDNLSKAIKQEQAAYQGAEGSMVRISAELGTMRDRYRNLSEAERENLAIGGKLLAQIQEHDAKIKKLDASIGNHQRNVGNYAGAWSGLGGMITQQIPVFSQAQQGMAQVEQATGRSTKGMMLLGGAIGVGVAAFGGLVSVMKTAVTGALEDERAEKKLLFALNGNIEAMERMLRFKERMMASTLFSEDEIMGVINVGVEMGRTEAETRKLVTTAMGLSRVTGQDLNAAMLQLSGTYEGNAGRLARLHGGIKDLTIEQLKNGEAVDLLNQKYGKFAGDGLNSVAGQVEQMKKYWGETLDSIGAELLTWATSAIVNIKAVWNAMAGGVSTGEAAAAKYDATMSRMLAAHDRKMDEINSKIGKTFTPDVEADNKIIEAQEKAAAARKKEDQDREKAMLKYAEDQGRLWQEAMNNQLTIQKRTEDVILQHGLATQQQLLDTAMERIKKEKSFETLSAEQQAKLLPLIWKEAAKIAAKSIMDQSNEEWSPEFSGNQTLTPENVNAGQSGPTGGVMDRLIGGMLGGLGVEGTEQELKGYTTAIKNQIGQLAGDLTNMWLDSQRSRINAELKAETAKVDQQAKTELNALENRRRRGLITEKQYQQQKEKIDEQAARKKDQLNREAFEKQKKISYLNAIINTALAVTSALSMQPFIVGLIMAVLAAAAGAVQIATIAGTKYEGAKGGLLRGPSHKDGGIKYQYGGDIVELEGGEAVINKSSIASNDVLSLTGTPRQIASDINSYRGYGVNFAAGGYTPFTTPRPSGVRIQGNDVEQTVDSKLAAMRVYVVETDITEVQGKVKKVQAEATW